MTTFKIVQIKSLWNAKYIRVQHSEVIIDITNDWNLNKDSYIDSDSGYKYVTKYRFI